MRQVESNFKLSHPDEKLSCSGSLCFAFFGSFKSLYRFSVRRVCWPVKSTMCIKVGSGIFGGIVRYQVLLVS